MKNISLLTLIIAATVAFADNENYDGQDVSGQNFNGSFINSSWNGANASGAFFDGDFTNSSWVGANATGAYFWDIELTNANFTNANLTRADFGENCYYGKYNVLASVNFTNAIITYANLYDTGFTKEQLYSTKSYQDKDVRGIIFCYNDLTDCDFSGQNLTGACIYDGTPISNANFTDAIITKTSFGCLTPMGFTKEQLYSTKSYKDKYLVGVELYENNMSGWDFSGQNLTSANFYNATLTNANFSFADLRGADMTASSGEPIYKATIMPDGVIRNFAMTSGTDELVIRKYTPATPSGANITAKIADAATLTGGARLTLEQGAELEILENASLTVGANSQVKIITDSGNPTPLTIAENAELTLDDGAILSVNAVGAFVEGGFYTFKLLEWKDSSTIQGLENLIKGVSLLFTVNGVPFAGDWDSVLGANYFAISATIPEPAAFDALFGICAFVFAACRRRK